MADLAKYMGMSQSRALHFLGPQSAGLKGQLPTFFGPDDEAYDISEEFMGRADVALGPHLPVSTQTTAFRVQGRSLQNRPAWVDDARGPSEMAGPAKPVPGVQNFDRFR